MASIYIYGYGYGYGLRRGRGALLAHVSGLLRRQTDSKADDPRVQHGGVGGEVLQGEFDDPKEFARRRAVYDDPDAEG
jgi:hypothetical protein